MYIFILCSISVLFPMFGMYAIPKINKISHIYFSFFFCKQNFNGNYKNTCVQIIIKSFENSYIHTYLFLLFWQNKNSKIIY